MGARRAEQGPTEVAAEHVLALARERDPVLGADCRVVAVDGVAGAGKTTLSAALVGLAADDSERVVELHMDDLYDGWRGLFTVGARVGPLLRDLHERGTASYRRFDWHRDTWAEEHRLERPDLLVLEGVASSHPSYDDLVTVRVWVGAPRETRLRRGLERDGVALRWRWEQFLADEAVLHARDRTRERADVVVDGLTGQVQPGQVQRSGAQPAGS